MTNTEMIKDMLERQKAYDAEVFKKDDEELVKKAASIGLIEDVNNDDSNEEDDF